MRDTSSLAEIPLGGTPPEIIAPTRRPFDRELIEFFQKLSSALIDLNKHSDGMDDAVAFGYWLRPSNLAKMAEHLNRVEQLTQGVRVPVGKVFHVAPSNVEVLFAYSWAMSTLCGCESIVRVSSKHTEFTKTIIGTIEKISYLVGLIPTWKFISTPKENHLTISAIVQSSDGIVTWGGDAMVSELRKYTRKPTSQEVVFPDRESIAVVKTAALLTATEEQINALARNLAKDIATFGQQACSSPRLLSWIGEKPPTLLRDKLFRRVGKEMSLRGFTPTASESSARNSYIHKIASHPASSISREVFDSLVVIQVEGSNAIRLNHPGCGLLIEVHHENLSDLSNSLKAGDQTISQFGFQAVEWEDPIREWNSFAPSRIVPIGNSLDFHFIWDGHDLIQMFTRNVFLESAKQEDKLRGKKSEDSVS